MSEQYLKKYTCKQCGKECSFGRMFCSNRCRLLKGKKDRARFVINPKKPQITEN